MRHICNQVDLKRVITQQVPLLTDARCSPAHVVKGQIRSWHFRASGAWRTARCWQQHARLEATDPWSATAPVWSREGTGSRR
jgi:hypothetical protein